MTALVLCSLFARYPNDYTRPAKHQGASADTLVAPAACVHVFASRLASNTSHHHMMVHTGYVAVLRGRMPLKGNHAHTRVGPCLAAS